MKHCVAAVAVSVTVGLAGCDDGSAATVAAAPQDRLSPASGASSPSKAPTTVKADAGQSVPGAPDFVALYPGAELVPAEGDSPSRQVVFLTDAQPEVVIEYYRQRAESVGLMPAAAINQGEARAFGASDRSDSGHNLQVIASPTEDGMTSVQLNWNR